MQQEYDFEGRTITLGAAMLDGETQTGTHVRIPLGTMNRHGLIAGATGTGKTKTLQVLAENLSREGVPVLLMDMKGDLSGLAAASTGHRKIDERHEQIGLPFQPWAAPVEILTLSEQNGVRLRATITEFGPVLLSRMLDTSSAQAGVLAVIFAYCDDHKIPLIDLEDLKKMLIYCTGDGKEEFKEAYGRVSTSSTGALLRKIIGLEKQGADRFFGERSFDPDDLVRLDSNGHGMINIVRLTDIQDRPQLFSTFMLSMLAEIYSTFPEQGDADAPELVIFIDEAHLVFREASDALMDQIEGMVKLIRSKGVGLYFVTQNPTDVPEAVLSQLGLKIQHALRAFTAKDRKAIRLTAQNYPDSEFYDTEEILTSLGIGEALVTALDEKGRPTPLAATMLRAPMSRMDVLTDQELKDLLKRSQLAIKYNEEIDRRSAKEIIEEKMASADKEEARERAKKERKRTTPTRRSTRQNPIIKVLTSASFIRGVMGILNKALR